MNILNFIKKRYIFALNILVFLTCLCFIFFYNECLPIIDHDLYNGYLYKLHDLLSDTISFPRFLPYILTKMYTVKLPAFFHLHPADFKVNYFVCFFVSCIYMLFPIFISKGFFILSNIKKNLFEIKENILLLPLSFIVVSVYYCELTHYEQYFLGIQDVSLFLEEFGGYFIFFPLIGRLYTLFINHKEFNRKEIVLYGIAALIIGAWDEYVNITTFFTLFLIAIIIFFFEKELLKNKAFITINVCFFIGIFIYYILSGNFTFECFGNSNDYKFLPNILNNFKDIHNFNKIYFNLYIIDFSVLWIILTIAYAWLFIILNKEQTDNKNAVKKLMIINFAPIIGYLICAYSSILIDKAQLGTYGFEHFYFPYIGYVIFLFSIFIALGIIYYCSTNICKTFVKILFFIIILSLICKFFPSYINNLNSMKDKRNAIYNYEKKRIIYSVFHEYLLLSENDEIFDEKASFITEGSAERIFRELYKNQIKGYIYSNKEFSEIDYELKTKALGLFEDEFNIFKIVKFSPLKKYDIDLTIEEIERLEKINGKNDSYLKAKAYLLIIDKKYDEALKLYKEYLAKYPKDIDTYIRIINIYQEQNKTAEIEKTYKKLIELYPENIVIMLDLANLYFKQQKYNKALTTNSKIIELLNNNQKFQDMLPVLYHNNAVIYKKMHQREKSKEYFDKIEKDNIPIWLDIIWQHCVLSFEDFYDGTIDYPIASTAYIPLF